MRAVIRQGGTIRSAPLFTLLVTQKAINSFGANTRGSGGNEVHRGTGVCALRDQASICGMNSNGAEWPKIELESTAGQESQGRAFRESFPLRRPRAARTGG